MKSPSFQDKLKSLIFFFLHESEDDLDGPLIIMGTLYTEEVIYLGRQQVKKCNEVSNYCNT